MIGLIAALLAVITTPYAPVSYSCDGSTAAFTVNFPYLSSADLVVTSTNLAGTATTLAPTTDFTTSVSSTQSTATLTLLSPSTKCPSGNILMIARNTSYTQPQGFRAQTSFDPKIHESSIDRLEMQIQQLSAAFNNTPSSLATVNARDFGVLCNGSSDDTSKIQAAANAAGNRWLLFPTGVCKITGAVEISTGTKLMAVGEVVLNQTTNGAIIFHGSGVSHVAVIGFTMTGSNAAVQPTTGTGNNCGAICFETSGGDILVASNRISGFFNGITGTNLTGFTVRDNEISHWRLYGVLASQSSDFHIMTNRMHDNDMPTGAAWSAVTTYGLGDTATANNLMWMSLHAANLNNAPPGAPPGDTHWLQVATYGAMATGNRGTTSQLRSEISFNIIYNNPLWDGIMSHDTDGLSIIGNNIRNVRIGLDLAGSGTGKYDEKLVVQGNYIEDTTTDAWSGLAARNCAIILFGADATVKTRNVAIVGNVTTGFNRFNSGTSASGAACISNSEATTVTGNTFSLVQNFVGNASAAIIANATTNGLTISGNSVDAVAGLPGVKLTNTTSDQITVSANTLRDGDGTGGGLVVIGSTIANLTAVGNSTNGTIPYSVATSTITHEWADFYSSGGANKWTRTYVTSQGGQGCITETSTALSAGLTNIDLVTVDLSGTNSADVQVVVEVSAQQAGNAVDTTLYRFRSAATGGRNVAANAVWVPAAATNMVRVDTDFASVGVAIAIPKLIWNASTNVATLQFQPQTTLTSYHVTATATSWRGVATCL